MRSRSWKANWQRSLQRGMPCGISWSRKQWRIRQPRPRRTMYALIKSKPPPEQGQARVGFGVRVSLGLGLSLLKSGFVIFHDGVLRGRLCPTELYYGLCHSWVQLSAVDSIHWFLAAGVRVSRLGLSTILHYFLHYGALILHCYGPQSLDKPMKP